jgi:hypothetical protein
MCTIVRSLRLYFIASISCLLYALTFSSAAAQSVISPLNGATWTSVTPTLTWTTLSGSTGYNVFLGTTNPPSFVTETTGTTYTPAAALAPGTTYYWRVAPAGTMVPTGRSDHFVAITDYGTNDADELNVSVLAKSQIPQLFRPL